ncbi:MAG TPA: OmpW family outer membrane protein [Kiritimatiellia bacterium]|nr:OmpW family outer membrane protein [Kiritimatiellia bacterium]
MYKALIATVMTMAFILPNAHANGLGFFASYWDTKDAEDEFGIGAKLQFSLDQAITMELRASIFQFEDSEGGIKVELDVIPLEAGLLFNLAPGAEFNPYIGGGAGYYIMDAEISAGGLSSDLDIDNEVGYYAVAGAELKLADNIALFVEAKYTWLKIKKVEGISADAKLDGFGGNAGLIIKW